jgi:hypothetical protein
VLAQPSAFSFGVLPRAGGPAAQRTRASTTVRLNDAGDGAGEWTVSVRRASADPAVVVEAPAVVTVPGQLTVSARLVRRTARSAHPGWLVLERNGVTRRVPFWLGVTQRRLAAHGTTPLQRTGTYTGNTARGRALVSSYRYPENPGRAGVVTRLPGPEVVYRVRITRPVANFGVAVLSQGRGVRIHPRVVFAGDESRLVGYTGLPLNLNPYLATYGEPRQIAGAVLPAPGTYDIVFDTPSRAAAGPFRFRFWIGDTTPPRLRLQTAAVARNAPIRVGATDAESGVDPRSLVARIGGQRRPARYEGNTVLVDTRGLAPGRHRLLLRVSDYQETRNMENVARILPNTSTLEAFVTIRG